MFFVMFFTGRRFFLALTRIRKNESLSTDNHWYRMNRFKMLFKFDCDIKNGWKDVCDEVALLRWDEPFSRRLNFLSFSPLLIRERTLLLKASKSPKLTHKMISQREFRARSVREITVWYVHNVSYLLSFGGSWSQRKKLYRLFRQ